MYFQVTEKILVQTEAYNSRAFEVTVGFSNRDMGVPDESVASMTEEAWDKTWESLKKLAKGEAKGELLAFLPRVLKVSQQDNVATRLADLPEKEV